MGLIDKVQSGLQSFSKAPDELQDCDDRVRGFILKDDWAGEKGRKAIDGAER